EELHRRVVSDPRRFLRLLDRALSPDDFEVVDQELPRILALACSDTPVHSSTSRLRQATSHGQRADALRTLRNELQRSGIDTRHAVIAAFTARVIRPGSSAATDDA